MRFTIQGGDLVLQPEPDYALVNEVLKKVEPFIKNHVEATFSEDALERLIERVPASDIAAQMNHNYVAELVAVSHAREIVRQLIENERFQNRLMRHINEQTVGLVNDAVERVVAIIESKQKQPSDVDY